MKSVYIKLERFNRPFPRKILVEKLKELVEYDEITVANDISDEEFTKIAQNYDILFTMWDNRKLPEMLADNPGKLKYICNMSGTIKHWIPACFIDHPTIQVTNWGDAPANSVAEGAMALLLTMLKDIPSYYIDFSTGKKEAEHDIKFQGSLYKARIGIYGMGVIAKRHVDMLLPFKPYLSYYDPYCTTPPNGVLKYDTLDELFSNSDIVVVHAGLCDSTIKSVNAELLAKLPDGGIIINTARAGIIDEDALMAELTTGRLRAGLDLMDPVDRFPAIDHPGRKLPNLICTGHKVYKEPWLESDDKLISSDEVVLKNVTHFVKGEPLEFTFDMLRYELST